MASRHVNEATMVEDNYELISETLGELVQMENIQSDHLKFYTFEVINAFLSVSGLSPVLAA